MADYDVNNLVKVSALQALAQRTKTELDTTLKSLSVSGNTVSFFKTADASGTAAYTFDFPEEIFLDQAGTTLVENFAFNAATYPGATNPNLDGKTVLVLAVKGDKETNPTVKYSFVDLSKLIDTYTAADNSITIAGYTVAVKVSAAANNAIELKNDGLHVDISGKADKVTGATANNIAKLDANGNLADSGYTVASDADVNAMLTDVFDS